MNPNKTDRRWHWAFLPFALALLALGVILGYAWEARADEAKGPIEEPMRLVCLSTNSDKPLCRVIQADGWSCSTVPAEGSSQDYWFKCQKDDLPTLRPRECHEFGCGIGCVELKPREHCPSGFKFAHNETGAFCCPDN